MISPKEATFCNFSFFFSIVKITQYRAANQADERKRIYKTSFAISASMRRYSGHPYMFKFARISTAKLQQVSRTLPENLYSQSDDTKKKIDSRVYVTGAKQERE